jgi:hypothetical protein
MRHDVRVSGISYPVAEYWYFSLESGALYLCGGIAFIVLVSVGACTVDAVRHASTIEVDTILMRLLQKATDGTVLAQFVVSASPSCVTLSLIFRCGGNCSNNHCSASRPWTECRKCE